MLWHTCAHMYAHLHTHTLTERWRDREINSQRHNERHGAFVSGGISQLNFYPAIELGGSWKTSKCLRILLVGPWSWGAPVATGACGKQAEWFHRLSLRPTPICLTQIPAEVWPLNPLRALPALGHQDSAHFGSCLQLPARPRQLKE